MDLQFIPQSVFRRQIRRIKAKRLLPCIEGVKKKVRMAVLVTSGNKTPLKWIRVAVPVTAPLGVNSNKITLAPRKPCMFTAGYRLWRRDFCPGAVFT